MKMVTAILVSMFLMGSVFALDATPKLSDIREVVNEQPQRPEQPKVYEIPMTAMAEKADGSGLVEVFASAIKVTKAQLQSGIARANKQIELQQKQVADLQAKLAKINELEA